MKKFKKNERRKQLYVVTIVTTMLLVLIAGLSYAVYQREEDVLFINATVGKFKENDIELAIKLDGEQVETPPTKDNYTVTVDCDNATGVWLSDGDKWGAYIDNISANKVKCEVNFVTPEPTLSEVKAIAEKTTISLSYTAGGIETNTTCVYGTDINYGSTASGVTNTSCNISGLSMDTTYYYKVCAVNVTGEACKEGSIKTKPNTIPFTASDVGKYVRMTPTATSYTISKDLTGYKSEQTINPSELNLWRVIKKNDDGTIEMVSEYASSKEIYIRGEAGYLNYIGILNTIAEQYTDGIHVQSSRHMGYVNQKEYCMNISEDGCSKWGTSEMVDLNLVLKSVGELSALVYGKSNELSSYWLGQREGADNTTWHVYYCRGSNVETFEIKDSSILGSKAHVRPIIVLKPDTGILDGSGTSASPYILN